MKYILVRITLVLNIFVRNIASKNVYEDWVQWFIPVVPAMSASLSDIISVISTMQELIRRRIMV
jgi:hypothetical protein